MTTSYREGPNGASAGLPNARELIRKTMTALQAQRAALSFLRNDRTHFVLEPIPNLCFTHKPFASSAAASAPAPHVSRHTQPRETIFIETVSCTITRTLRARCIFCYTGQAYTLKSLGSVEPQRRHDCACGISARCRNLVSGPPINYFQDEAGEGFPPRAGAGHPHRARAFMHLDTVLTRIDTDKFLIHPSVSTSWRCSS